MNPIDSILTHPGSAHKDEFLACCVLLALYPVPISRREPSPEDLANPGIAVVDVGLTHDPALSNYDHHQFPKDHPPACSLTLVLQALGLYEDAKQFCRWLEPTEWFDCRGPGGTARWLGVERDVLDKLISPIDITLLRHFALSPELKPGEPLWEIMRMVGGDLLEYLRTLRARIEFLGRHAEIWDLELAGSPARVLFIPRTDPMPEEPGYGIDQFIESRDLTESIVGLVYPDRRGAGYGLSRFRDNARLDFTQIADQPEVHFAHARGFVAKTSANDPLRLRELIIHSGVSGS